MKSYTLGLVASIVGATVLYKSIQKKKKICLIGDVGGTNVRL